MQTALFLCTGNYYRSRFAELVFNKRAAELAIFWRAASRALALERGSENVGPISPFASTELRRMGITPSVRMPMQATVDDLEQADLVVALNAREHRCLLEERFSCWMAKNRSFVEFWAVDDIDALDPPIALERIRDHVDVLCQTLARRDADSRVTGI